MGLIAVAFYCKRFDMSQLKLNFKLDGGVTVMLVFCIRRRHRTAGRPGCEPWATVQNVRFCFHKIQLFRVDTFDADVVFGLNVLRLFLNIEHHNRTNY